MSFTSLQLYSRGKSLLYPLGGSQSQSGRGGEEKKSLPRLRLESKPGYPARNLVRHIHNRICVHLILKSVCNILSLEVEFKRRGQCTIRRK
jgi:hypothetical protein